MNAILDALATSINALSAEITTYTGTTVPAKIQSAVTAAEQADAAQVTALQTQVDQLTAQIKGA